jgi:mannose-1-phosphate guanylyltransferase/phosphomannomutase
MILAAGLGSRLRPLTSHLPKPLVPILNRPLLWYLIGQIKAAGIEEIALNLHYHGGQIRDWLGHGHQFGVDVTYSDEAHLLGSAGGVRRLRDFFGRDSALVIHGDILFDVDLAAVIQYHLSHSAQATLVLHPEHRRYDYGKIRVNACGEIGQFVQHHAPWVSGPLIDTVFTGVQVIAPEVLDVIPDVSTGFLTTDVYPDLLSHSSRLYGYLMHGYWSDIGTPRRYWETNMDVISGRVGLAAGLSPEGWLPEMLRQCHSSVRPPVVLPSTLAFPADAIIGPEVVLGDGCTLAGQVRLLRSVLWPGVQVGQGVTIERSIVMNDVTIPAGSHVVGKIVSPTEIGAL